MKFTDHKNHNCTAILDNGEQYKMSADFLHNEKLDFWLGWHCDAGSTRIFIDNENQVFGATCRNDYLGNLNSDLKILNSSTICKRARCVGCTDDLLISKKHPTSD